MKKAESKETLAKEAALWDRIKTAVRDHPGMSCRK